MPAVFQVQQQQQQQLSGVCTYYVAVPMPATGTAIADEVHRWFSMPYALQRLQSCSTLQHMPLRRESMMHAPHQRGPSAQQGVVSTSCWRRLAGASPSSPTLSLPPGSLYIVPCVELSSSR